MTEHAVRDLLRQTEQDLSSTEEALRLREARLGDCQALLEAARSVARNAWGNVKRLGERLGDPHAAEWVERTRQENPWLMPPAEDEDALGDRLD